ncbi:hypothetical protein [Cystobacter ferrugineus]|uniref:PII-uridylyltransferase/Glutamine-synthetase adenylyltransferase domain-containing protein n=1 Tax=Cystobacter ferrugineus TaxID=83449 RepID=A0A1L9B793_9BACT|nr:hypothetical protein [Cystobacter ferrugineus]OJH38117.1 hypothetical protein BON30_23460 [Cystobacter ferrugineus]
MLPGPTRTRLLDWLPALLLASGFAPRLLSTRPGLLRVLAPRVRGPHTLTALDALQAEGLLTAGDADVPRQGYLFLRRVENRLRLVHASSLAHILATCHACAARARRLLPGASRRYPTRCFDLKIPPAKNAAASVPPSVPKDSPPR